MFFFSIIINRRIIWQITLNNFKTGSNISFMTKDHITNLNEQFAGNDCSTNPGRYEFTIAPTKNGVAISKHNYSCLGRLRQYQ